MKKLSRNKQTLLRVAISAVLIGVGLALSFFLNEYVALIAFIPAYLIVGYDVIIKAVRNICHGQVFDENFLMIIASIGAFIIGESPEAVAVLLLYQVGEVFQRYAVDKSRTSIASLMELRPDRAFIVENGEAKEVDPEEVAVGSVILVRPGDRIPLDGEVVDGSGSVDCSALTGESVPVEVSVGDKVLSGSVNCQTALKIKTTAEFYDSTVSKILELAENAVDKKAKAENYVNKFATVYTPIVVVLAVLVAVVPSLFTGEWSKWIYSALTFLVVSCPCAIVISVPLAFFCGIGGATFEGVLIKGSNYIETIAKTKTFVLDKTGTVTKGEFVVSEVYPEHNRDEVLKFGAIAESKSTHPIAKAVQKAVTVSADGYEIREISGKGMVASFDNQVILAGNEKLMQEFGVDFEPYLGEESVVYVAENGKFIGRIVVSDVVKPTSAEAIADLKKNGGRVIMLSGDGETSVKGVAEKVGITEYYARLLPNRKLEILEKVIENASGGTIAFVADAVLMYDDLGSIVRARKICKKTVRIAGQNIVFSLFVKVGIMVLSLLGFANMWLAVIGDVGVAMIAILNSIRAGKISKGNKNC